MVNINLLNISMSVADIRTILKWLTSLHALVIMLKLDIMPETKSHDMTNGRSLLYFLEVQYWTLNIIFPDMEKGCFSCLERTSQSITFVPGMNHSLR